MKKTTTLKLVLSLLVFLYSGIESVMGQCPSVTLSNQSFCNVQSPTIADLIATDNGNGVVWYSSANGTVPLNSWIQLIHGTTYYADDNSGSCGNRQNVFVTIYGPPTGISFQGVCVENFEDATIEDLEAAGNNIQWYLTPFGGTPLPAGTQLISGTVYYASQTNPDTGCETSRLPVLATITLIAPPEGEQQQSFCNDPNNPATVGDLTLLTSMYNWYLFESSVVPLSLTTPLIDGHTYYATTVIPPCESISRLAVTVTLYEANNAGESNSLNVCEPDIIAPNTTVDLFNGLGGNPQQTGTWIGPFSTSNGHLGTINLLSLTTDVTYTFVYIIEANEHCPTDSAVVNVTILSIKDAGTDGEIPVCENTTDTYDLFGELQGSPDVGGVWTPALDSGSGIFNPAVDSFGVYTYSFDDECNMSSATVTVSQIPTLDPGTDGTLPVCEGDTDTYNLFERLNGNPDTGGSWSPALASGTGFFDPTTDSFGVYTYSFNDFCNLTATVTVIEVPFLDAGSDGEIPVCENTTDAYDLFGELQGSPDVGGVWTPALDSGSGIFNPAVDSFGVYTYSFDDECNTSTATVTVTLVPFLDAGLDGALPICEGDTDTHDLFGRLNGNPDTGGTWSPALTNGTGIFDPVLDAFGVYTYSFNDACSSTATVTVIEVPFLDAGSDGGFSACENSTDTYNLFDYLEGTPDVGGLWTPTLDSGIGVFNPAIDSFGIYTYYFDDGCNMSSATVTVNAIPAFDPGMDAPLNLCFGDTNLYDLFDSLGGVPDVGGTWSPALTSGTGIFDPTVDSFGIYTYSFNDQCSTSATVTVSEVPELDAGTDREFTICTNGTDTYDLFGSLGGNPDTGGVWFPALVSGTGIFDPAADNLGNYTYSFNDGCNTSSATVTIIGEDCEEDDILIPDGFSPNEDGINDYFEIVNIRTLYPNYKIEIYNRYGNILFKGDASKPDWDGTTSSSLFGDETVPVGVYFFIIEFNDNQREPLQGRLYLSR